MILANQYRPVTFAETVGQSHVKAVLKAAIQSNDVPPALLFSGTRGTGKTTTARVFAAALNCAEGKEDACGQCPSCKAVQSGTHPSVLEVDAASSGGIDEVRKIRDLVLYGHSGEWRVVILDEAHSMSTPAYNALLKMLEEPPANTVIILVTTEPEKIIGTVKSRAMPFEFRRVKNADVEARLRHIATESKIEVNDDLFSEISRSAQGGLRDAVMAFDQAIRAKATSAEDFREFYGISDYSLPLMWAAIRGDHSEGFRLVSDHFSRTGEASGMVANLSRLVSELLVIHSEGRPAGHAEEALAERVEMAHAVTTEKLVKVIEVLWDLRARTRATENDQKSSMEMGFALIANSVKSDTPQQREEPKARDTSRLSFQELQKMTG